MKEILKLLEADARMTPKQIAAMLGRDEAEVKAAIAEYEQDSLILGYKAMVNWEKTDDNMVTALIEVRLQPQRGEGFDRIAERIYQYEQVESVYLMSGAYDLTVIIKGRSLNEVATFVSAHLATIEGVTGTATHFILKKYKELNCVFSKREEQEERVLFV